MNRSELTSRIISGVRASTIFTLLISATNILTFLILGRLYLSPSDFGAAAVASIVANLGIIFIDFGFGAALIQRRELAEAVTSSVFWCCLLMGLTIAALVWIVSPYVEAFFGIPGLSNLVAFGGLAIAAGAIGVVPFAILRIHMKFAQIGAIGVAAEIIGLLVAISLASLDAGAWSIVAKTVVVQTVIGLGYLFASKWKPRWVIDATKVRDLLGFSSASFLSNVVSYGFTKLDEIVIGRMLGSSVLGSYTNAYRLVLLPVALVKNQMTQVLFPVLSAMQDDKVGFRRLVEISSWSMAIVTFPVLGFLSSQSNLIVSILLGDNWSEMSVPLTFLAAATLFEAALFPGVILQSLGRAGRHLKLAILTRSIFVLALGVGCLYWQFDGLLIGIATASFLNFGINLWATKTTLSYPCLDQIRNLLAPIVGVSLAILGAKVSSGLVMSMREIPQLFGIAAVYSAIYVGFVVLIERRRLAVIKTYMSRFRRAQ